MYARSGEVIHCPDPTLISPSAPVTTSCNIGTLCQVTISLRLTVHIECDIEEKVKNIVTLSEAPR